MTIDPETGEILATEEDITARPATLFLTEHRRGALDIELGEALARVTAEVQRLGKKGKVTLTFTIEPPGSNSDWLLVSDDITEKPPKERKSGAAYPDEAGNLLQNDPTRPTMW